MALITVRSKSNVYTVATNQIANGDSDTLVFAIPDGRDSISLQLKGTTTAGNISASYQPQVSNDNVTWTNLGSPLALTAVASGSSAVVVLSSHTFKYMKFVLSGLTGTNAGTYLTVGV